MSTCSYNYKGVDYVSLEAVKRAVAQEETVVFKEETGSSNWLEEIRQIRNNSRQISTVGNMVDTGILDSPMLPYLREALTRAPHIRDIPIYVNNNINAYGLYVVGELELEDSRPFIIVQDANSQQFRETLLHEIIHAYTYGVLTENIGSLKTTNEILFREKVERLYELATKEAFAEFGQGQGKFYGLTNPQEFVSEAISNPQFRAWLKSKKVENKSFFDELVEYILQLFGIQDSNILDLAEQTIREYLENKSNLVYIFPTNVDSTVIAYQKKTSFSDAKYYGDKIFTDAKKDEETGKYKKDGNTYGSVTQDVIPTMRRREALEGTTGERAAERIWGETAPDVLLNVDKSISVVPVSKATFTKLVDLQVETGKAKGTIFHKLVHYYVSGDVKAQEEAKALMAQFGLLEDQFEWVSRENVEKIINKTGTDFYSTGAIDKLYSEKTILSNALGWGGTMDLFLDHSHNVYSIYDLKTGVHFDQMWETSLLKYGYTPRLNVFDEPRSRAKLQLMLYAFMIKVENPDARFRHLELLHIRNRFSITENDARRGVDVEAYLHIIKNTLQNENKEVYDRLSKLPHFDKIFDPSEYQTITSRDVEADFTNLNPSEVLKLKTLELQELVMQDKDIIDNREKNFTSERAKKIQALMKEIIALRGTPGVNYDAWDRDIGWMDRYLGSATSSTNPYVQLYYSMLSQAKLAHRKEYDIWKLKFNDILERLRTSKGLKPKQNILGGTDRKKLFDFAIKANIEGERVTERFVTNKDAEWAGLNEIEKEFLTFVNNSVGQFFVDKLSNYIHPRTGKKVALANKVATIRTRAGREVEVTNLDLHNKEFDRSSYAKGSSKFKWYEGFMPKVAPTLEDVRDKHGFLSQNMLTFLKRKYSTNFFEATFEGLYETDEAIPMKYLDNDRILAAGNYSRNVELIVDSFVKQHFYKQHMDEVYTFGQALKFYLKSKENPDQSVYFEKTIEWFEDSLELHVRGHKMKNFQVSGRSFSPDPNKFKDFNFVKFLRSVKNFFAGPTMWLKPVTGTINAIFANMVTWKEAFRNQLGLGAGSNFDLGDLTAGYAVALELYTKDAMSDGKFRQNKAFMLMEKFGYLPDSYDWYTTPNQLLTAKNKLFTTRTMMLFHTLPEEVLATAMFVAQLKAMKFTNEKGETMSVWDGYKETTTKTSDGQEIKDFTWQGGSRGKRNISNVSDKPLFEDLTDLTPEEVNSIKFLYEKIHGGYRADERVAAEYHIFGEMVLQLKKYFPSILKNIWASRGVRHTQGYFKEVDGPDGQKILKWTPEVIEGRYRLLIGMFFNYLGIISKQDGNKGSKFLQFLGYQTNESYDWKSLSATQKEDMYDFGLTMAIFLAMLFGYHKMWEPGEEDTFKKLFDRLKNDFAGYVYPLEIMKNVVNFPQPVAGRKSLKLVQSSAELFWSTIMYGAGYDDAALTKNGHLRGYTEFSRNIHLLSAWHDIHKALRESPDGLQNMLDYKYK